MKSFFDWAMRNLFIPGAVWHRSQRKVPQFTRTIPNSIRVTNHVQLDSNAYAMRLFFKSFIYNQIFANSFPYDASLFALLDGSILLCLEV